MEVGSEPGDMHHLKSELGGIIIIGVGYCQLVFVFWLQVVGVFLGQSIDLVCVPKIGTGGNGKPAVVSIGAVN